MLLAFKHVRLRPLIVSRQDDLVAVEAEQGAWICIHGELIGQGPNLGANEWASSRVWVSSTQLSANNQSIPFRIDTREKLTKVLWGHPSMILMVVPIPFARTVINRQFRDFDEELFECHRGGIAPYACPL